MTKNLIEVIDKIKELPQEDLLEIEKAIHDIYNRNKKAKDINRLKTFNSNGLLKDITRQDAYHDRI